MARLVRERKAKGDFLSPVARARILAGEDDVRAAQERLAAKRRGEARQWW